MHIVLGKKKPIIMAAKQIKHAEASAIVSIEVPASMAIPIIGGDSAVERTMSAVPRALIDPR